MKIIPVIITIAVLSVLAWFINGYKLTQCDFEAPYRCEVVHAVGLIPPMALITVWADSDSAK